MKKIYTIFALGNILGGHLKKAENNEDCRALQNLSVVMPLVGNFLLSFKVMRTLATILSVLTHRHSFFFFFFNLVQGFLIRTCL